MFLLAPRLVASHAPGISIQSEHVAVNIVAGKPEAHYLANEQFKVNVQYDGSNPFFGSEKCGWQFIFVAPQQEEQLEISSKDPHINLFCIPPHTRINQVLVTEEQYSNRFGVWLRLDLEGDSDIPFITCGLINHALS